MSASLITAADAVVSTLNAASLSQAFIAERGYVVVYDLATLTGLKVTVVPPAEIVSAFDLGRRHAFDGQVDVWLQKTWDGSLADGDSVMQLAEEIMDLFRGKVLAGTNARNTHIEVRPVTDPNRLDSRREFACRIMLTFRTTR